MLYEVTVKTPEGRVKKIISPKTLSKKWWSELYANDWVGNLKRGVSRRKGNTRKNGEYPSQTESIDFDYYTERDDIPRSLVRESH